MHLVIDCQLGFFSQVKYVVDREKTTQSAKEAIKMSEEYTQYVLCG